MRSSPSSKLWVTDYGRQVNAYPTKTQKYWGKIVNWEWLKIWDIDWGSTLSSQFFLSYRASVVRAVGHYCLGGRRAVRRMQSSETSQCALPPPPRRRRRAAIVPCFAAHFGNKLGRTRRQLTSNDHSHEKAAGFSHGFCPVVDCMK